MLEAYRPTPRRFYTYLPMICGSGGAFFGGLVSFASGNPLDVSLSLMLAGALGFGMPALMVGANAVCNERAAWFNYQAALTEANSKPAPMPDPADDVKLKITRAGNIRTSNGYRIIPDLNDPLRGKNKKAQAQQVYQKTMEIVERVEATGELDGIPGQIFVDVNVGMWLIAQNIDRMGWKFGEKRWTEGNNHPFALGEYKVLVKWMENSRPPLLIRPTRGNTAPTPTKALLSIIQYYRDHPARPQKGPVAGG